LKLARSFLTLLFLPDCFLIYILKQQLAALASEIHHKPGHGVTKELFTDISTPLGFTINIYPHNHDLGDELFEGVQGKAQFKYRMGNILSGRNPKAEQSALSLMCLAVKS
jgi:hypothetical protein